MAECGLCKDCKWWPKDYEFPEAFQECKRIKDDSKGLAFPVGIQPGSPNRLAILVTYPDFGCVQWEVRPSG